MVKNVPDGQTTVGPEEVPHCPAVWTGLSCSSPETWRVYDQVKVGAGPVTLSSTGIRLAQAKPEKATTVKTSNTSIFIRYSSSKNAIIYLSPSVCANLFAFRRSNSY